MKHTKKGEMFTDIVLETFKLSGMLSIEGDRLTQSEGISSARWKILGALSFVNTPLTVSQIARSMGQTRQSVQRLVDVMTQDGLLKLLDNPQHKRAKLVSMTSKGESVFKNMGDIQIPWANEKSKDIDISDLETTLITLKRLSSNFE